MRAGRLRLTLIAVCYTIKRVTTSTTISESYNSFADAPFADVDIDSAIDAIVEPEEDAIVSDEFLDAPTDVIDPDRTVPYRKLAPGQLEALRLLARRHHCHRHPTH